MRVTNRAEYIWSTRQEKYLLTKQSIIWTNGPVALCKGASSAQTNLADQQAQFYSTLTNDYNTQFAQQGAILNSLKNSLSPIIQAGPNQYGFSAGQTADLNSQAIQGGAQQYANLNRVLKENQAAAGGGNTLLPSGVASQQQAALGAAAANQQSNALLGIKQAGYQQGNAEYNNAISQLGGVASQYNPTGYAGQATGAGNAAFGAATEVNKENAAASPWNLVGGILGGVAQGALGGLTGGLSTALGGLFRPGGSSNSGSSYDSGSSSGGGMY